MKHIDEWNKCIEESISKSKNGVYMKLYVSLNRQDITLTRTLKNFSLADVNYDEMYEQLIAQYFFPEDAL